jgi:ubiquinone/menaquinone biosynthesis C-methylase UbiE
MTEKMSLEQIREFWTRQAEQHAQSSDASWSDQPVIEMEIREITPWLEDGDRVLDVGCANGFSTVQLAAQKAITIRGLDYIPEMIESAKQRLAGLDGQLAGTVQFDVGDITQLQEPDSHYNKVIVIRVIINLGDWKTQQKGLKECVRVLKPGGTLLLSEASKQGWESLNRFRAEWGLEAIPMPSFNTYLDDDRLIDFLSKQLELVTISNYASTYYVGTRVLKPLLAKCGDADIHVADPQMLWNRWCAQLPPAGDFGTQKLFVFRKK